MTLASSDLSENKVLVTVGRVPDLAAFVNLVGGMLFDNFTLTIAVPLEDEIGVDGNIRFIGFVTGVELPNMTMDNQAAKISATGGALNARVYETMDAAISDAKDRYGFNDGTEYIAERNERVRELILRFPRLNADEVEFGAVFDALMTTGRLTLIRGLVEDDPVCVLAMITQSEDDTQMKVHPMAVLITSPKMQSLIELPFPSLGG